MKQFLQTILQEIVKKTNSWNIRHLVEESFFPATQGTNVHCKPIRVLFLTGKNLFSSPENPLMKKFFPCLGKVHRENPVLALYWPSKGLQCRK